MLLIVCRPASGAWPEDAIVRWAWTPEVAPEGTVRALPGVAHALATDLLGQNAWLAALHSASEDAHTGWFRGLLEDGSPDWSLTPGATVVEVQDSPMAVSMAALRRRADEHTAPARTVLEIAIDLNQLRRAHDEWVADGPGAALLDVCHFNNARSVLIRFGWEDPVVAARPDGRAARRQTAVPSGQLTGDVFFSMRSTSLESVHHHQIGLPFWPTTISGDPPASAFVMRLRVPVLFVAWTQIDSESDDPMIPASWQAADLKTLQRFVNSFDRFGVVHPGRGTVIFDLQARAGVRQQRLNSDADRLLRSLGWRREAFGWRAPNAGVTVRPLVDERQRGRPGLRVALATSPE